MIKRFFKLTYVLALIGIILSLPIFIFTSIQFDRIVVSTYKAKCLSNNQYVVLQGSQVGEIYVMDELYLDSENRTAIKEQLNFYCKYYNEIQPHIVAYSEANSLSEEYTANMKYREFESGKAKVYSYPELYKLELVSNETNLGEIYYPLIDWLFGAVTIFVILQIFRMSYVYVVFGEVVWHPFRQTKK